MQPNKNKIQMIIDYQTVQRIHNVLSEKLHRMEQDIQIYKADIDFWKDTALTKDVLSARVNTSHKDIARTRRQMKPLASIQGLIKKTLSNAYLYNDEAAQEIQKFSAQLANAIENPLCFSNKLMLVISELSEAMEGDRKSLKDDKLPHRDMREVELADAVIRIFDLAGAYDMDLAGAIVEKLAYNATREDHKIAARKASGGKAY